jgi:hypothetical protein
MLAEDLADGPAFGFVVGFGAGAVRVDVGDVSCYLT